MHDRYGSEVKVGDEVNVPCKVIEVTSSDTCNVRLQPIHQPSTERTEDFWTVAGCCSKGVNAGMSVGLAIEAMKQGKKVCRAGWNGKGMYLYYVPANCYETTTSIGKKEFGDTAECGAYICMSPVSGPLVVGWTPNVLDMLAEDWMIVE